MTPISLLDAMKQAAHNLGGAYKETLGIQQDDTNTFRGELVLTLNKTILRRDFLYSMADLSYLQYGLLDNYRMELLQHLMKDAAAHVQAFYEDEKKNVQPETTQP